MRTYFHVFVSLLFFNLSLSCQSPQPTFEEFINEHFESVEVESILKLKQFFEIQVSQQFGVNNEDSYANLVKYTKKNYPDFVLNIDFKAQQSLYQELNEVFFATNWDYGVMTNGEKDISYISLGLRTDGKLMKAFKKINNSHLQYYYQTYLAAGDLSPANIGYTSTMLSEKDAERPEIKLLLIIHYLTLNDRLKRKDKI